MQYATHSAAYDAGSTAWHTGEPYTSNQYGFGTRAAREWDAGWQAEQRAADDASVSETTLGGGWLGSYEHMVEARAFGLTAL